VGLDAARVTAADASLVRERDGLRWYRCLRCDSWMPREPPVEPTREHVPGRSEIDVPERGRVLRDRFVLRLIALDRLVHVVVLVSVAVVLLVFVSHRSSLEATYDGVMNALLGSSGGPKAVGGWLGHLRRFFVFQPRHLDELALAAIGYAALETVEMVGLWFQRRWAEYLTFVATAILLPLEVYELSTKLSPLKIAIFVINLAIVLYLLFAKRLFGLRGGAEEAERVRRESSGWAAFDRATPTQVVENVE
jgi:uncharacterized membrane protein (DUF2068 family)